MEKQQHNLDQFIKQKFEEREFEFNPAHWEGAANLIETGEKWLFWKNFAWAALSVSLFFAGGIGGYYFSQSDAETLPNNNIIVAENSDAVHTNIANSNTESKDAPITLQEANTLINENNKSNTLTTTSTNTNAAQKAIQIAANTSEKTTSNNTSSQPSTTVLNIVSKTTSVDEVSGTLAEQSISESSAEAISKIETSSKEAIQKPVQTTFDYTFSNESIDYTSLQPIALSEAQLQIQEAKPNPTHPIVDGQPQKFYAGILASGMSYGSGVNFSGAQLGFTFKYRLATQLSLNADLLYHYRPGEYSSFARGENIIFENFGSRREEVLLKAKHMNYLEVPVYLQYQLGKSYLEAGLSANILAAVRGEVGKNIDMDSPTEPVRYEQISEGWIENFGYKTFNGSVMLGYQVGLNERVSIGVRASYLLGDIHNEKEISNMQLSQQARLNVGLNARWYIF